VEMIPTCTRTFEKWGKESLEYIVTSYDSFGFGKLRPNFKPIAIRRRASQIYKYQKNGASEARPLSIARDCKFIHSVSKKQKDLFLLSSLGFQGAVY